MKILPQTKRAPRAIVLKPKPQVIGHQFAVVELQLVAGLAVDNVHTEVLTPAIVHLWLVVALHDENQFLDVLRDGSQPLIVLRGVLVRRREQFDDGPERTFGTKNGTTGRLR